METLNPHNLHWRKDKRYIPLPDALQKKRQGCCTWIITSMMLLLTIPEITNEPGTVNMELNPLRDFHDYSCLCGKCRSRSGCTKCAA